MSVTAFATRRSFTGFAGKLPFSCQEILFEIGFIKEMRIACGNIKVPQTFFHNSEFGSGAYLGGGALGHGPLWVARIAKLHRKLSKIKAWPPLPPLCKLGIRLWARNHLILGKKWDEI